MFRFASPVEPWDRDVSPDGRLKARDVGRGLEVCEIERDVPLLKLRANVMYHALSNRLLARSSPEGTVTLWEVRAGRPIGQRARF